MNTNDRPPAPPARRPGQLTQRPAPYQALRDHVGAKAMPGAPHLTPVQPQAKPVAPPAPPAPSPPTPPPVATVERPLQDPVERIDVRKPCTCESPTCARCNPSKFDDGSTLGVELDEPATPSPAPARQSAPEPVQSPPASATPIAPAVETEAATAPLAHPLAGVSPEAFPRAAWGAEKVARWYINRGLIVFPACAPLDGGKCTGERARWKSHTNAPKHKSGKHPVGEWGGAGKLITLGEADITKRWRDEKHNTALPCGRNGGGYTVALDIDGPTGEATIAAAESILGALPPTLVNTTGKGRHLLFSAPPGLSAEELAAIKGSISCVRLDADHRTLVRSDKSHPSSFDLRADGGYIMAPGSKHASGAEYTAGGVPIAPLPRAWWDALPRREGAGGGRAKSDASNPLPLLARGTGGPSEAERTRLYFAAALPGILTKIRAETETPDSPTNDTINAESLRAFRLALGAGVDLATVRDQLVAAGDDTGHPRASVRATVASAQRAAESKGPEYAPDRPAPGKASAGKGGGKSSSSGAGAAAPRRTEEDTTRQGGGEGPPVAGIPSIIIGPDLHRVADEAVAVLGAHPKAYWRESMGLVRILAAPDDADDPGAPTIDRLPRPTLTAMLSEVATWLTYDRKGDLRRVQPPELATAVVHVAMEYPGVRELRGIVEAPTLRRDGTVAADHGYDAPSRLYIHWRGEPLNIPERPTHDQAREAYGKLRSLFAEFSFAGDAPAQEVARAAVVAAMLTPLARAGIVGPVPAFVFEADQPNAGKSLAASVCGALVTGRVPGVRQHTADDDEMAKRIASIAMAGHPVALFDNVRVHVEGGAMELALTAYDTISIRVLGSNDDKSFPWRTVIYMTMNHASYSSDISRRVIHIAMKGKGDTREETAQEFTIPDLVRHIVTDRATYLRAAFTILRAHQLTGRPMLGATLDSFEAWSRIVAGAVRWASGHDPVSAKPPESANRDANVARAVTLAWRVAFPDGKALRVGKVLEEVKAANTLRPGAEGPARTEALCALRDALANLAGAADPGRITTGSLGKLLASRVEGREYVDPDNSGRRFVLKRHDTMEHGSVRYYVDEITGKPAISPAAPPAERGGYGDKGGYGSHSGDESPSRTDDVEWPDA